MSLISQIDAKELKPHPGLFSFCDNFICDKELQQPVDTERQVREFLKLGDHPDQGGVSEAGIVISSAYIAVSTNKPTLPTVRLCGGSAHKRGRKCLLRSFKASA
jgi:hypothetical protein